MHLLSFAKAGCRGEVMKYRGRVLRSCRMSTSGQGVLAEAIRPQNSNSMLTGHVLRLQIPAGEQRTVMFCYWAFLGFNIAVLFNVFGSLVALCALGTGAGRLPAFFLSACYACAGIPGAWILW